MADQRTSQVADAVPCSECGAPIPGRVLREGHRDLAWCGVLVVTVRDNPAQVLKVLYGLSYINNESKMDAGALTSALA